MKTYIFLLTAAAAGLYVTATPYAPSEYLKSGYMACISAQKLTQFENSTHRQKVKILMEGNCIPTDHLAGYPFTTLADGRTRVYLEDDQYADLFVQSGAL